MTSKTAVFMTAKVLTLVSVLLLAACDGGIFGTGDSAADAAISPSNLDTAADPADSMPETDQETTTNVAGTIGDSEGVAASESDTGNDISGGDTTGSTAGSTAGSTTGSIIDAGATDSITDDDSSSMSLSSVSDGDAGKFINNTPTLSGPDAQVVVINTSSLTLNVISPSTQQDTVPFEIVGIAPNTSSESTALSANATDMAIVDSNNPARSLLTYSEFNANPSTLTTLLIRNYLAGINAVALTTETQTSDPGLAKVRVVQGGALGDDSQESQIRLQSAGDNPGGVESTFGPLSFFRPQSEYKELFAGDYELVDLANRFTPSLVTLSGNTVYTLLLTGNGMNEVRIIIDSE